MESQIIMVIKLSTIIIFLEIAVKMLQKILKTEIIQIITSQDRIKEIQIRAYNSLKIRIAFLLHLNLFKIKIKIKKMEKNCQIISSHHLIKLTQIKIYSLLKLK